MPNRNTHVAPNSGRGGWDSKDSGKNRASKHFETKKDAVDWARQHSIGIGTELVIHNQNGRIAQKDSHGNDNCPPKG